MEWGNPSGFYATLLRQAKERLWHKRPLVHACTSQCRYELEPTRALGGATIPGSEEAVEKKSVVASSATHL